MVSESSGRNASERRGGLENPKAPGAEPAPKGRRQHGPPQLTEATEHVEPGYLLGNILRTPMAELVASERQHAFGQDKLNSLPKYCRECEVQFACHGECPRNRFITTPDGEPGLNYLCAGYKLFFNHIDPAMKAMASLLRQGRWADEIMQLPSTQASETGSARVGRNHPCSCGSGKKFKHCHGRTTHNAARQEVGRR
jgi:uncharacterized protein